MTNKSVFGRSETSVAMIAYLGFFITGIAIFTLERENRFVRFCALQSTIFFTMTTLVEIAISTTFDAQPLIGPVVLALVTTGVIASLIYLTSSAYKRRMVSIPLIGTICLKIVGTERPSDE